MKKPPARLSRDGGNSGTDGRRMIPKTPSVTSRHVQPLFLFQLALFSSCSPLIQERICEGASTPYVEVLTMIMRPSLYGRKKQLACRYFSRLFLIVQMDPIDSDFALTSVIHSSATSSGKALPGTSPRAMHAISWSGSI